MVNKDLFVHQDLRERLESFSVVDQERNDAIGQLLCELDRLRIQQRVTYNDYVRERDSCRLLQEEVEDLKAKTDRRGFVAVLIDADADDYLFRENFLNGGVEGGKYAANELYAGIVDYLKSIKIKTEDLNIVVRAFANISGLQTACVKKDLLRSGKHISHFTQGFTQRRGLFDFIDVGPGKEKADFKIKECLDLFVNDYQCQHIIVGACQDAGFEPYLSNYASDSAIRHKISLLAGGTMHASFKNLGFPREPLKMEKVFAPATKNAAGRRSSSSSAGPQSPASSEQQVEKRSEMFVNIKAKEFADKLKPIRDSEGKRVDKKLKVDPDCDFVKAMRMAKFCGYYYLRGQCDGKCNRRHDLPALNSYEFDCLWHILRQAGQCFKVRKGKDCEDPLCFYGHQNLP